MGQQAAAVMVGIIPSKALWKQLMTEDGDYLWDDLPWEKQPECGENRDCLGFAAVLSNGGDDDEGELRKSALLADFGATYKKDVARARKKWAAFAAWLKEEKGVDFHAPGLLIAVVERA